MKLGALKWTVLVVILFMTSLLPKIKASSSTMHDNDYLYLDTGMEDSDANRNYQQYFELNPRDVAATTECDPTKFSKPGGETSVSPLASSPSFLAVPQKSSTQENSSSSSSSDPGNGEKTKELHKLMQHLFVAEGRVKLEATEIKKAQAVAAAAQEGLEEAANHVRVITAALQSAQQEVASAAIRAQTAQLQLAAHDQLLFAARQNVDALSSQMVGLQAEEGITQPKSALDIADFLAKLKQPLPEQQKPTAIPAIIEMQSKPNNKPSRITTY